MWVWCACSSSAVRSGSHPRCCPLRAARGQSTGRHIGSVCNLPHCDDLECVRRRHRRSRTAAGITTRGTYTYCPHMPGTRAAGGSRPSAVWWRRLPRVATAARPHWRQIRWHESESEPNAPGRKPRKVSGRHAGTSGVASHSISTPYSRPSAASPFAYPWSTTRNFQSPLCRYTSAITTQVSWV